MRKYQHNRTVPLCFTYYVSEIGILVHNTCLTNKEARIIAAQNGWTEVNGVGKSYSVTFTDGQKFYSNDRDGHGDTVWKVFPDKASLKNNAYYSTDEYFNVIRGKKK